METFPTSSKHIAICNVLTFMCVAFRLIYYPTLVRSIHGLGDQRWRGNNSVSQTPTLPTNKHTISRSSFICNVTVVNLNSGSRQGKPSGSRQGKPQSARKMASSTSDAEAKAWADSIIATKSVVVISKSTCPFCKKAITLLEKHVQDLHVENIDGMPLMSAIQNYMKQLTGGSSVPRVFIGGKFIGGCDDTVAAESSGELKKLLEAARVAAPPA